MTVVLAGRLAASGRILGPGEALHHPPGSTCRLTALRGAPTAVLTVRPLQVVKPANIPAQRGSSQPLGVRPTVAVTSMTLAVGDGHELLRYVASDAFILVLSGTGRLLADGGEVMLLPGDLVYVRAGERHGLRAGPQAPFTAVLGRIGVPDTVRENVAHSDGLRPRPSN